MGADLELVVGGRPVRFPAVWLRDNCPCPDCLAPGTGQKLKDITDIPNGLAITRTEDAGESVLVTFAPDQHRSAFPRTWLEDHALGDGADGDGRTEDDKELWLPADLAALPARGRGGGRHRAGRRVRGRGRFSRRRPRIVRRAGENTRAVRLCR
jgi:Gamma-butyrobetaine hydroxylase-like, N-terminal